MRVVFDNNVLISAALLEHSTPYLAFRKAVFNDTILRAEEALIELYRTINKAKFDEYFKKSNSREELITSFSAYSIKINISIHIDECRDPKDNIFLELAISGNADCIISGDDDLLVLNPFRGIPIITANEFLDKY